MLTKQITAEGALYSVECYRCGATNYSHEWAHDDHNERRDAMENGQHRCDECGSICDGSTFTPREHCVAGRYAHYDECAYAKDGTPWLYGSNDEEVSRELDLVM